MSEQEEIQRRYYTETAAAYDEMHPDPEHHVALSVMSMFVEDMGIRSVLDVGCGTGRAMRYLARRHDSVSLFGIEPVTALVDQGWKQGSGSFGALAMGRGQALPFGDNSIDAVCEFAMLHHVPDPNAVVREMVRVARKAVFLSDSNRFGQGRMFARWTKFILYKLGLWGLADAIRTKGKGYTITAGDGLAYSYSVFDSYEVLAKWADRIILVPTVPVRGSSWLHPLLTSGHILLCATRTD